MVLITVVMGVYKPTYNWGALHCRGLLGGKSNNHRLKMVVDISIVYGVSKPT